MISEILEAVLAPLSGRHGNAFQQKGESVRLFPCVVRKLYIVHDLNHVTYRSFMPSAS